MFRTSATLCCKKRQHFAVRVYRMSSDFMVEGAEHPNHFHGSVNIGTVNVGEERHLASSTLRHIEESALAVAVENLSSPSQALRRAWTTLAIRSVSMGTLAD